MVPTSRLDRVWRDHWVVHAMTPTVVPDVSELRRKLAEFMTMDPLNPLSCNLSEDATHWVPVPAEQREARAAEMIVEGAALGEAADPYAVMLSQRPPEDYRAPFRMVIGRDSVLFHVNHVIGDAMVITQLTSQLAQGQIAGLAPARSRFGVPLLIQMAIVQSFPHGREWWRRYRSSSAAACDAAAGEQERAAARVDAVAVGALLDADRYRAFRQWRAIHHPETSVTALMAAATYRAFRQEGLPVAGDGLYVLVDLRRYLPPTDAMVPGNLAVSVLVDTDLDVPDRISRDLRAVLKSASAIPALLKSVVLQPRSRRTPSGSRRSTRTRGGEVRMTFNSMQRNPGIAAIPWLDGRRARYMGMSYPIAADGISVFACVVDDRMEFSASFRPDVLDRESVQRALHRLVDMPALLSAFAAPESD